VVGGFFGDPTGISSQRTQQDLPVKTPSGGTFLSCKEKASLIMKNTNSKKFKKKKIKKK